MNPWYWLKLPMKCQLRLDPPALKLVMTELIPEETIEMVQTALSAAYAASVTDEFELTITIATQEKSFTAEGYALYLVYNIDE